MAKERGRLCVPHCFSTGVNQAASIHWMTAYEDAKFVEYCLAEGPLIRELIDGVPSLKDGYVTASDRPGFGIEINEDVLERFIVR